MLTAKSRVIDKTTYYERHHIIPESFFKHRKRKGPAGWVEGNANDKNNIVKLTAHEHYVCHKLLPKMVEGTAKAKMKIAFTALSIVNKNQQRYKISSRDYIAMREIRKNQIVWNKGIPRTAVEKAKMSATRKLRASENNPLYNVRSPCSPEKSKKHSLANITKRWVHNPATGDRKYIHFTECSPYLAGGWKFGAGPTVAKQEKLWVHNHLENKLLPKADANQLISLGWLRGMK
jgi:hypothetical protein